MSGAHRSPVCARPRSASGSRRSSGLAAAWELPAPRASVRVSRGRLVQIDPLQVRERGQPRQHIAELVDQVVAIAGSECARELADLLGEPAERGVPSARGIALHVRGTHRLLEVVDVHGADESNARRVPARPQAIAAEGSGSVCLARLQAYIRWSASAMSWSNVSGSSGSNIATPAENDSSYARPSCELTSSTATCKRVRAIVAVSYESVAYSTQNASAPIRAIRSESRNVSRITNAPSVSIASPAACPRVSFTCLRPS